MSDFTTGGVLGKMLGRCDHRPDPWKVRHNSAMNDCDRFERMLLTGVEQFHLISKVDEVWNSEVAQGALDYEQSDEEEIFRYYRNWLRNAEAAAEELKSDLLAGFYFQITREFQRCLKEARGVCSDDAEFFADGDLVNERDRAIDAHLGGETVEIQGFDD